MYISYKTIKCLLFPDPTTRKHENLLNTYERYLESKSDVLKHNIAQRIQDILERIEHLLQNCSIFRFMTNKEIASVIVAHIIDNSHQAVDFYIIFEELDMPDTSDIIKHATHIGYESKKEALPRQKPQPSTIPKYTGNYSFYMKFDA